MLSGGFLVLSGCRGLSLLMRRALGWTFLMFNGVTTGWVMLDGVGHMASLLENM